MEDQELATNIRKITVRLLDTPLVPVGIGFLGQLLGSLHIAAQLLEMLPNEVKEASVELPDCEYKLKEFLLLTNVILDVANEKLQLPKELRNE